MKMDEHKLKGMNMDGGTPNVHATSLTKPSLGMCMYIYIYIYIIIIVIVIVIIIITIIITINNNNNTPRTIVCKASTRATCVSV